MKALHKNYLAPEPLTISNLLDTFKYKDILSEGLLSYLLNDHANAIRLFDEVLSSDSNDYDAWFFKGMALEKIGNTIESEECLKKAKELSSSEE